MRIIPKKICPTDKEHRWIPLIWLPYFAFYFLQPALERTSAARWLLDAVGGMVFLVFVFRHVLGSRLRPRFYLAGIVLLGMAMAPINSGAATFFIYGCAMAPFLVKTESAALKILDSSSSSAALKRGYLHLSGLVPFVWAGALRL